MAATGNEVPKLSQLRSLKEWIVGQIDEVKRLKPVNEIVAGTDLDTLTEPGSWFCDDSTSVTNVPGGVAAEFLLYVYSGGVVVAHELHTLFGTWWRWKREDAGSWGAWVRVLAPYGPLPLESGGTGADNAADARTALGLGNIYSMAPYVRSKSSSARLVTGTVVVNLVQSWCTLLNDASIRSLIGRSFDQGRDCIVVMNGDKNVQENTVMTPVYNASTKEINLRVVQAIPSTAITAVSGSMRINYILASG